MADSACVCNGRIHQSHRRAEAKPRKKPEAEVAVPASLKRTGRFTCPKCESYFADRIRGESVTITWPETSGQTHVHAHPPSKQLYRFTLAPPRKGR